LLWDNDAADEAGQIAEGQTLLALAERSRPAPLGKRQRAG
jgi:hypothetical protein